MTKETMNQQIEELEEAGWQADAPPALAKQYAFANYTETLNFLMEMGDAAEAAGVMPTVHIERGTDVNVRVGRPPVQGLSEAEITLAVTLATAPVTSGQ